MDTSKISPLARVYQASEDRVVPCAENLRGAILSFRQKLVDLSYHNAHDPAFQKEFVHLVDTLNRQSIDAQSLGE